MRRLCLVAALALSGCVPPKADISASTAAAPLPFPTIPVASLPGWQGDNQAAALTAFVRGCHAILLMPADQSLGGTGPIAAYAGQAGQWQQACTLAKALPPGDDATARNFFENNFTAYAISSHTATTGYFAPEYPGSKNLAAGYRFPVYAKPADPALASLPRAAINSGALTRKTPVTAYLSNPVDAYMLQIEGQGRILLPNGHVLDVGPDGQNGQPYTPIGRILLAAGLLSPEDVSFSSIASALSADPAEAKSLMEQNANYVFLRPLGELPMDEGAPGPLGVPVMANRSIAVDPNAIPLGAPLFLAATDPAAPDAMDRLTLAQDTDSGLHGTRHIEIFLGGGPQAETLAGSLHLDTTLYLLLPRPAPIS